MPMAGLLPPPGDSKPEAPAGARPGASPAPALDADSSAIPEVPEADFAPLPGAEKHDPALGADPYHKDSQQAHETFDRAAEAAREGSEAKAVQLFLKASKLAEDAREWYLAALACERVADFLVNPRPPQDYERAVRMYLRAAAAYERCGLYLDSRRLSYAVMNLKRGKAPELGLHWFRRLELWLFWAAAGYGLRPLRVIGTAVLLMFLYGFLYWVTGGVVHAASGQPAPGFWNAVYFSGVTFATIGYGDYIPAGHAKILALSEGVLGLFIMGLFVAVLANRLSKV